MKNYANIKITESLFAAYGKNDFAKVIELFSDDAEWWCFAPSGIPFAGRYRKLEQINQFLNKFAQTMVISKLVPVEFINDGDTVVILGKQKIKIKATGEIINSDSVHICTLYNGKITSLKDYSITSIHTAALKNKSKHLFSWLN